MFLKQSEFVKFSFKHHIKYILVFLVTYILMYSKDYVNEFISELVKPLCSCDLITNITEHLLDINILLLFIFSISLLFVKDNFKRWFIIFMILTIVIFNQGQMIGLIGLFCSPVYNYLSQYSPSFAILLESCSVALLLTPIIVFLIPKLLNRRLLSFITPRPRIEPIKIVVVILIYSVVVLLGLCYELYTDFEYYTFQFELIKFLELVAITIVLYGFKTFMVEFVFSAYLTQFMSHFIEDRLVMIFIIMLYYLLYKFYTIPLDEFTVNNVIFFIFIGCFYGVIVLLGDGLEMTLGMSFVNYILPILFVTNGGLNSLFLNESNEGGSELFYYISILINTAFIVFIIYAFRISNWKQRLGLKAKY